MAEPSSRLIIFSEGGNSAAFQRDGWSFPEPGYTWSVGRQSGLVVPRVGWDSDGLLAFEIAPHLHPDLRAYQRLRIVVNGHAVSHLLVSERQVVTCWLPYALLAGHPLLTIGFEHPDAFAPSAIDPRAEDDRPLALTFFWLRLESLSAAPLPRATPPRPPAAGSSILADASADVAAAAAAPLLRPSPVSGSAALLQHFICLDAPAFEAFHRASGLAPSAIRGGNPDIWTRAAAAAWQGLGAPENIQIRVRAGKFWVRDLCYGFEYCAEESFTGGAPEAVFDTATRELPARARVLHAALGQGGRIFVLDPQARTPDAFRDLVPLLRSAAADNCLLLLTVAEAGSEAVVESLAPRLIAARIPDGAGPEAWLDICRRVLELRATMR